MLAEHTGDLITRHAPDGRILGASRAALVLLGRVPVELEGLTPRDLAHPDDLPAIQTLFRDASYFGRPVPARRRRGCAMLRAIMSGRNCAAPVRPSPPMAAARSWR